MGTMINRRRVVESKSLPYDAEIEYLESNGVDFQYVELPFTIREGLDIYCRFLIVEPTNFGYIFGNQTAGSSNYLIVRQNGITGLLQVALAPSSTLITERTEHLNQIRTVDVHLYDNEQTVSVDGTQLINNALQYDGTTDARINLWHPESYGPAYFRSNVRIYHFKLWLHQKLMLDLIPVRVGTTGYMYDKVSGQLFGNAGKGDFILGSDK